MDPSHASLFGKASDPLLSLLGKLPDEVYFQDNSPSMFYYFLNKMYTKTISKPLCPSNGIKFPNNSIFIQKIGEHWQVRLKKRLDILLTGKLMVLSMLVPPCLGYNQLYQCNGTHLDSKNKILRSRLPFKL